MEQINKLNKKNLLTYKIMEFANSDTIDKIINNTYVICRNCYEPKTIDKFHKGRHVCIQCYRIKCRAYYKKRKQDKLLTIYKNMVKKWSN